MSVCYYYLNSAAKMRRWKSGLNIVYNLCPQEFLLHFLLEVGFLFFLVFFWLTFQILCCSFKRAIDSWFCVSI